MHTKKRTYVILVAVLFIGLLFLVNSTRGVDAKDSSKDSSSEAFSPNLVIDSVIQNSKGTTITSCIDLPSSEDWIPEGVISSGENIYKPSEMTVLDVENKDVFFGTHRCYEFVFTGNIDLSGKFIIRKLSTTMPDFISQEECDNTMSSIAESDGGLDITCKIGDHGVSFTYTDLPKGLTETDVATKIRGAFTKTVEGPWLADIQ